MKGDVEMAKQKKSAPIVFAESGGLWEEDAPERLETKFLLLAENLKDGKGVKLGTFMGVFVPTLQNILGIILFLRLPWITGQAGIGAALCIVLLGCSASFLTSLSMSAIATNGVPQGGGAFSVRAGIVNQAVLIAFQHSVHFQASTILSGHCCCLCCCCCCCCCCCFLCC